MLRGGGSCDPRPGSCGFGRVSYQRGCPFLGRFFLFEMTFVSAQCRQSVRNVVPCVVAVTLDFAEAYIFRSFGADELRCCRLDPKRELAELALLVALLAQSRCEGAAALSAIMESV